MSDFIHVKGQVPTNLDLVRRFDWGGLRICFYTSDGWTQWVFENENQAKAVYLEILASKSKDIGDTELTAEELKEIGL